MKLKLAVVGSTLGKTALIIAFSEGRFMTENIPTVVENYSTTTVYEGESVELDIMEIGCNYMESLVALAYDDADVVLVCYDITDYEGESLINVDGVSTP